LTISFASKAQVSLSHDHPLQTRQTGSDGQQPPPLDACNFVQLFAFVNTSQCYNTLVEDAFLSENGTTPGQLAEQYCTQSCAGNFIDFVMNTWNCTDSQKDIFRLAITRICSQNDGRRCNTYSLADLSFTGCELATTPTNPVCSANCRDSILSAVNEAGCCLALEVSLLDSIGVSVPIIDNVLGACDIELSAPCPLDYAAAASASISSLSVLFVTIFVAIILSY
jgi:hypothetical protein